jgi:uncharacterized protein
MEKFIGREKELAQLCRTRELKKASLVVVRGRRRIGKSTLVQQFGKDFPIFLESQGLAPREGMSNGEQLQHFCKRITRQLDLPEAQFRDWEDAFEFLAKQINEKSALLLLDEISWMAQYDKDFVGQFKIAWDLHFKKCPNLIVVLCGSVSSWIDQNILNNTGLMGRISLTLTVNELPLNLCNLFWQGKSVSSMEKLKILSVTGGVPRYLEEIIPSRSAEDNLGNLCFHPTGILFHEFQSIFRDIFSNRASAYQRIVECLVDQRNSYVEICRHLGTEKSGVISSYLEDLESSGFIRREYKYSLSTGKKSKLSRYRLRDNYLRFYLKVIAPKADSLLSGVLTPETAISSMPWDSILGLQFENLVLNNLDAVFDHIQLDRHNLMSASPYFQNATNRSEAVQIDLLIICKYSVYVCEIKFRKKINVQVIADLQTKIKKLKIPKHLSVRPVLIYVGELEAQVKENGFFDHLMSFEELLTVGK